MTLSKLLPTPTTPNNLSKYALCIGIPSLAVAGYFCYRRFVQQPPEPPTLEKEGDTIQSLKTSGNTLFKTGKYGDALELYSKAILLCNHDEDKEALEQLFQNRAAVFEKLGDFPGVIKETSAALKLNPKYIKALHRRSKAYKATGFLEESLSDITAVCILEGFSSPSSVQLADDVLKEIGSAEGARLLKERETEGRGVLPSAHTCTSYLRGFYNCPLSRIVVGREGVGGVEEGTPHALALAALAANSYDQIIPLTTTALTTTPPTALATLAQLRYLRGTFRFLYGHTEAATLDDLRFVVAHTEDKATKASALIKMASHYALVDKEKECEGCFEESAVVWSDNVDLWHHRGQVLLTRGNLPSALELMTKAAELEPGYAVAVATKWYVQYRILGGSGDIPGADACVREFESMVRRFSDSPDVFSLYGQILMENQRFAEAELQFARVVELDKTNAAVLVHKAMAKFQQSGDAEEAIRVLEKAVLVDDRNEFVYETLGTLYLQGGFLDPAIAHISTALSLARSAQELTILSSLKKAAQVQLKVRDELGLEVSSGFFK